MITIHDISPENFKNSMELLRLCEYAGARTILAVIPARKWSNLQINQIRSAIREGHELAQHGYSHSINEGRKTFFSRLHGALFSNDVAEHLVFEREELLRRLIAGIEALVVFGDVRWYVPPAWSVGPLYLEDYREMGVDCLEHLWGYESVNTRQKVTLPILGYQATNIMRHCGLLLWNTVNDFIPTLWCRIALHPEDIESPLVKKLKQRLNSSSFETPSKVRERLSS